MLCCFRRRAHHDSRSSRNPCKDTVGKDTPISMSFHSASIPHALDSPDALHSIFALDSSIRGYDAARDARLKPSTTQRSLDFAFRFGKASHRRKKSQRALGQLTNHLKQKSLEGHSSRNSEQVDRSGTAPIHLLETTHHANQCNGTDLLGNSRSSVCLTELLASRAASDGGYDSDAKSIQTSAVSSIRGTLKVEPKWTSKSSTTIEVSQDEDRPSPKILPKEQHTARSTMSLAAERDAFGFSPSPRTPVKRTISSDLRVQYRPPGNVIYRRENDCISEQSSLSLTPQLHAGCSSHDKSAVVINRFSSKAPQRSSSLSCTKRQVKPEPTEAGEKKASSRMTFTVCQPKTDIARSSSGRSFTSKLDRQLLQYISEQVSLYANNGILETSSPITAVKVTASPLTHGVDPQDQTLPPACDLDATTSSMIDAQQSNKSQPLHLFDMRISQRLASTSSVPAPPSIMVSNNTSLDSFKPLSRAGASNQTRAYSDSRLPSFINIEHNRCPSDPTTRELFEPTKQDRARPNLNLSPSQSSSISASQQLVKGRPAAMGGNSSFCANIFDGTTCQHTSSQVQRDKGSFLNANSIAVGGRSASGPLPRKYVISNDSQSTHGCDFTHHKQRLSGPKYWNSNRKNRQGMLRGRKATSLKASKFVKVDTTPTPVSRRLRSSTEANEELSVIDIEHASSSSSMLCRTGSSQAVQDKKNEEFSDFCPSDTGLSSELRNLQPAIKDTGRIRNTGAWFGFGHAIDNSSQATCSSTLTGGHDSWYSSQQEWVDKLRLQHQSSNNEDSPSQLRDFTGTCRHNDETDSESFDKIIENNNHNVESCSLTGSVRRRSKSVDHMDGHQRRQIENQQQNHRRSIPVLKTSTLKSSRQWPRTPGKGKKFRKGSLPALNRCIATGMSQITPGRLLPSDDALGIWGKFPKHSREQRNGPAGSADKVKVRDFENERSNDIDSCVSKVDSKTTSTSVLDTGSKNARNLLPWNKSKINRQFMESVALSPWSRGSIRPIKTSLTHKIRRLYRTKSSEPQAYAFTPDHRSSVSTELSVEYPELDCLPGEGSGKRTRLEEHSLNVDVDGAKNWSSEAPSDVISGPTSHRSQSLHTDTFPLTKTPTETWFNVHRDYLSDVSVLRSDEDIGQNAHTRTRAEETRPPNLTPVLQDRTIQPEVEPNKEGEGNEKGNPLKRDQNSEDTVERLRIPGGFY